jgi:hypothetical protein
MEDKTQNPINKPTSFYQAIRRTATGLKVRRLEWQDENVYAAMIDEKIMIYNSEDKKMHPWTINLGDIGSMDWVIKK